MHDLTRALSPAPLKRLLRQVGKCVLLPAIQYLLVVSVLDQLPEARLARMIFFLEPVGPTASMVVVVAQIVGQQRAAEALATAIIPQLLLAIPMISLFVTYALVVTG